MKIVELWAKKVIAGERTWEQVPRQLRDQVKEILLKNGFQF